MANHKSSVKRARQTIKVRALNRSKKSKTRTFLKRIRTAITEKNKEDAVALLPTIQKLFGKLAKTGTMKKQTASRRTSRLAKQVNSL